MEQKTSKKDFEKLRKQSLNYSIKDGAAYAVMDSAGNGYLSPYALALGANNAFIGFLSSVPGLISSLFQLKTPKLMEKHSRKAIVTNFALLQALMWLPLVIISIVNTNFKYALPILLISYTLLVSFNAFISPAWSSWMKDLVKENESGKFFGRRSLIVGFVGLIAILIAGFMLDLFKKNNAVFVGFAILFSIALFARLISRQFLKKKYEPKLKLNKKYYFSFIQFIKKIPCNNFGRFVIFVSLFQLGVYIASPFFTVYILKDLKFSYAMYTILTTAQALATLLSMPLWGKFSDKYGSVKAMKITSMLIPLLPFLWLISRNFCYLVAVQIFAGFFWAGFNLAASIFIYNAVTRERMGLCAAYSNILQTIGVFVGATLGGLLSTYTKLGINPFFALFILSGIMRFLIPIIMMPKIKEVRRVKQFKIKDGIKSQIDGAIRHMRI